MTLSPECSIKDSINNYDEPKDTFDIENSTREFYESALKFVMSLYSNNNFNNNDVNHTQFGMIENILKPIASILKNIVKINISENILAATFNRLEGLILDPFNYYSSEHHLNKWLIENKLLYSVQQITINNQMCPINHGGEIHNNEKVTKGPLLPLKLNSNKFLNIATISKHVTIN